MRHLLLVVLAASLEGRSAAQAVIPAASPAPTPQGLCGYYPTGPELPHLSAPQVGYDDATGMVTVVLHVVRNADLEKYPPYYLAAPARPPVRMKAAGPYAGAEAVRRFGAAPSDPGEFWTFTAPLPRDVSFAVYFEEVWRGEDVRTGAPCSSVVRRVVASVAAGPQRENERGPSGLLPLVRLIAPVSTETLNSLRVRLPNGLRGIDSEKPVRTVVRFHAAPFRPRRAADVTEDLDTRRGFDVAVSTSSAAPASREYRFVIGRDGESGEFVVQQFAWELGDAVAENGIVRSNGVAQPDGSRLLRLESGYGTFVALRINTLSNGTIQIVDATR